MKQKSPLLRIWEMGESRRGGLIAAVILAVIGVIAGLLPYFAAAGIMSGLLSGKSEAFFYLYLCSVGLLGYLLRTVLYNLALSCSHKATFSILKEIRRRVLEKMPKMPLGTITNISSGKMKQMVVDQIDSMETTLAHLLPEMTSNLLAPVLVLICLFLLDYRMALLSLISIPAGMFFMMSVMAGYGKDYEGAVAMTRAMNETIVEYISGIEVIKAFNQGKHSYEKFTNRVLANASYYYQWMKKCQFRVSLGYAVAPATLVTVLPGGWLFYQNGSLSAETFVTSVILSLSIVGPLIAAMGFVDNLAKIGTTVSLVDEVLAGEEQVHGITPAVLGKPDICLERISFGYEKEKEILHKIDLQIPAGTMTALVGPSGSGKSTIARLIAGFWDVKEGRIMLGGVDERDIPLKQLYDQVAFVTQDNYLFDDTIRENIRMGRMTATDQEVEAAARASGCDGFIRKLEQGYDTKVGGGGAHLSGGECQRIAIARAMLKDAPVVILDEATAYIDPENEAVVQKAVADLVKGKTLIVIAHRLSTIVDADQIVVVNDGRIEGTGTHEELRKSSPLYESMWQAHISTKEGDVA